MQNAVSPVLAIIAKDMLGLQTSANKLEQALARFGTGLKLMAGGAAGIFGGIELGKGILDIADKGEKLIHQQNMLTRAGLAHVDVLNLTADAYKRITMAAPTATAADALRVTNEMRSVLGDLTKATAAAPMALKVEAMIANATGKDAEGEGFALWRAMEMKGITTSDPAMTNKLMDALMQDIIGSGGKLTAGTYQQIARRAGAAWIHATPEFAAGPLSVLAADLGGDGAGTAIMTLRNLLTGATVMSKQQFQVLSDAGLIDKSKVSFNANHTINAAPGAIAGSLQYGDDPYAWAQFIKSPLMNLAKGDPKVFDSLLAKLGRNRNAIKMLTMFTDEGFGDQIAKDVSLWSRAMGINEGYDAMLGRRGRPMSPTEAADMAGPGAYAKQIDRAQQMADYTAVMKAFQAQWESMTMAIGGPIARGLIPVLQNLTTEFTRAGQWAEKHQDAIKYIGEAVAGISAAMVVIGGAAVIAGAAALIPGGIVAVAVAAIGVTIATLAAFNWGAVSEGFHTLIAAMNAFFNVIDAIPGRLGFVPQSSGDFPTGVALDSAYKRQNGLGGYRQDPEAARGRAYMSLPASISNTKVDVKVMLDGRSIAAAVSTYITRDSGRSVNSSSGFDGSAAPSYPDMHHD